jgi:hypothetical protein
VNPHRILRIAADQERGGQPDSRAGGRVASEDLAARLVAEAAGAYGDQVLA